MIQGEAIPLGDVIDVNSRGKQAWSASGGCVLNRQQRTLTMGASDCLVRVSVARWKKFPARTSRRNIRFSRGEWAPSGSAFSTLLDDGSAIVAGEFYGKLQLGSLKNVSKPCGIFKCDGSRAYVAKFGADGVWTWLTNAVGPGGSRVADGAVLADGSIVIVGTVYGEQTFGAHTVNAELEGQGFIAKLNTRGLWDWVDMMPVGSSFASGPGGGSIDVASDGALLVEGSFDRPVTIGGKKFDYSPDFGSQSFVGKLTDRGVWAWSTNTWADGGFYSSVTATTDGGVIVVGCVEPKTWSGVFGSGAIVEATKDYLILVVKYSNEGKTVWKARMTSSKSACVSATAPTADGGVVIAGKFEKMPVMQSASPATRNNAACIGTSDNAAIWKVDAVCFNDWQKFSSVSESQLFVAEISKDGQWTRGVVGGAAGSFNGIYSIQRFADGTTVVGGVHGTTTTFGKTTLKAQSYEDGGGRFAGFLAKLTTSFEWAWAFAPANDDFAEILTNRDGVSLLGAGLGVPLGVSARSGLPASDPSRRENELRAMVSVVARQN